MTTAEKKYICGCKSIVLNWLTQIRITHVSFAYIELTRFRQHIMLHVYEQYRICTAEFISNIMFDLSQLLLRRACRNVQNGYSHIANKNCANIVDKCVLMRCFMHLWLLFRLNVSDPKMYKCVHFDFSLCHCLHFIDFWTERFFLLRAS